MNKSNQALGQASVQARTTSAQPDEDGTGSDNPANAVLEPGANTPPTTPRSTEERLAGLREAIRRHQEQADQAAAALVEVRASPAAANTVQEGGVYMADCRVAPAAAGTRPDPRANASERRTLGTSTADLPAALQDGGLVDVVLRRSAQAVWGSEKASELHKQITADVARIRAFFGAPAYYGGFVTGSPSQQYSAAIGGGWTRDSANHDHVFRFSLATAERMSTVADSLWDRAWVAYIGNSRNYDEVLGDFIPESLRDQAHKHLAQQAYARGTNATAADDWAVYRARLDVLRHRPLLGLSTGLPGVDAALGGGLRGLTLMGGGPGVGKTSFALAIALAALHRHPTAAVLFGNLDMSKTVLYDRLLCHEAGIGYTTLVHDSYPESVQQRIEVAEGQLLEKILPRLRVLERGSLNSRDLSVGQLLQIDRGELVKETGATEVLVVLDYLQLLDVPEEGATSLDADFYRVGILQHLQTATRTDCLPAGDPFLVISEVRKGDSRRSRLTMEDLLGSTRLSYGADCILLLEPRGQEHDTHDKTVPLTLRVAKGRDGVTRTDIPLEFAYATYQFREANHTQRPAQQPASACGKPSRSRGQRPDPLAGNKE
jgi:hypothetical protein